METTPHADLLTADEVARVFRVSPQTIYRWGHDGTLEQIRVGSTIRFRRAQVESLLKPAPASDGQATA